jgi:hypothetical protein
MWPPHTFKGLVCLLATVVVKPGKEDSKKPKIVGYEIKFVRRM